MASQSSPPRIGTPAHLILIGHIGFTTDQTANGTVTYPGGPGLAAAALLDAVDLMADRAA